MNESLELGVVCELSARVASLTDSATLALTAFKKARGARVVKGPFANSTQPPSSQTPVYAKWREREYTYVTSYYDLKDKIVPLVDPLMQLATLLSQRTSRPEALDQQRQLVEANRTLRAATELYLEFDLIEVPQREGGYNATVADELNPGRHYSVRRSIGFRGLEPMIPAFPLTYEEAFQQAQSWILSTATGNAEVFDLSTGKVSKIKSLPRWRVPMGVEEALGLLWDKDPSKILYATISLIYHAPTSPTGGFDGRSCCEGHRLELDFIEANSHNLCRCGANIRLGSGDSGEDHVEGCCGGGTW